MPTCREDYFSSTKITENIYKYICDSDFQNPIKNSLQIEINFPGGLLVDETSNLPNPRARGGYDRDKNIIYLQKNRWCLKTLIHESLHATSYFAYGRFTEYGNILLLNEGITEFLTGYILFDNYESCYNTWVKKDNDICNLTYETEVRTIATLAREIGIKPFIDLYIWRPDIDWKEIYTDFLTEHGFTDVFFAYPDTSATVRFKIELEKKFGEEFVEFLEEEDLEHLLDYSDIPFQI